MQFTTAFFALTAVLASRIGLTAARSHGHCACQAASGGEVDAVVTAMVVQYNPNKWELASSPSTLEQGAHFAGTYAIAKNNGKIDGDDFFNQCKEYGAADSTCF
ncbi:putative secreted in xylem 5 protein [Lasiodiplodia theobromae]|uniref:Secreted in xylem 5 protein n=2 Tax=Lasiodiplodia TaxID=66739 RepID=A0A5N5CW83_9PEZI|nr:DNA helicase ino80 [Lasiodiplodia theobromae]KAB2569581.1 hypothetical protein DBV05_g11747 [Lasiodiplodia theobromae]KAF4537140.1 DNA helicase ino80 [Lasiodiplodia theobromae]KAF9630267.1 putative secreted in xylem 5 protein [Lasiodiplodia theobromae]KAK0618760.1 hypothetical protein DIS24_g11552 [Lasiodiplodia hormozganensis]